MSLPSALAISTTRATSAAEKSPPTSLAGALVGFWPHNLPKARIFLGDTGSLMLGLVVAVLLLGDGRGLNLAVALAALALPLGDVALSCARRAIRGKPRRSIRISSMRWRTRRRSSVACGWRGG